MDSALRDKIGSFTAKLITASFNSGLTWDEAVAAFGCAARGLAVQASGEGDGTRQDCIEHALKRFNEGLEQNVSIETSVQSSKSVN